MSDNRDEVSDSGAPKRALNRQAKRMLLVLRILQGLLLVGIGFCTLATAFFLVASVGVLVRAIRGEPKWVEVVVALGASALFAAATRSAWKQYRDTKAAMGVSLEKAMQLVSDRLRRSLKWCGRINGPLVVFLSLVMLGVFLFSGEVSPWLRVVGSLGAAGMAVVAFRWTRRAWRS